MRNPKHTRDLGDFYGSWGTAPMRQVLAERFGPKWAEKSPAEMLFEMAQWVGVDGEFSDAVVPVSRVTLQALAVYAGMQEE